MARHESQGGRDLTEGVSAVLIVLESLEPILDKTGGIRDPLLGQRSLRHQTLQDFIYQSAVREPIGRQVPPIGRQCHRGRGLSR